MIISPYFSLHSWQKAPCSILYNRMPCRHRRLVQDKHMTNSSSLKGLPSRNLGLRFIDIHSFLFPSAAGFETHKFKEVRGEGWHVFFHKPLKERMLVSRKNGVGTQREAESSIRLQVPGCSTFLGSSGILAFRFHDTQIIFKQYLLLA